MKRYHFSVIDEINLTVTDLGVYSASTAFEALANSKLPYQFGEIVVKELLPIDPQEAIENSLTLIAGCDMLASEARIAHQTLLATLVGKYILLNGVPSIVVRQSPERCAIRPMKKQGNRPNEADTNQP